VAACGHSRRKANEKTMVRSMGWTYRPISWEGLLTTALAFAFYVQVFIAIDRHSHSVSDTLYGIFPYVVPTLMILHWIAAKTCRGTNS
jgi:hypothetical protein